MTTEWGWSGSNPARSLLYLRVMRLVSNLSLSALSLLCLAFVPEARAELPSIDLRGWDGQAGLSGLSGMSPADREMARKLAEVRRVREIQAQRRAMMAELQARAAEVGHFPAISANVKSQETAAATQEVRVAAPAPQGPRLAAQPVAGDFIKFREVLIDPSEPSKGTVWVAERDANGSPVLDTAAYQHALSDYELAQRARGLVAPTHAADELRRIQQEEGERILASVGDSPIAHEPKLHKMEQDLESMKAKLKRE